MNARFSGGLALAFSLAALAALLILRRIGRLPQRDFFTPLPAPQADLQDVRLAGFARRASAWLFDLALVAVVALGVELARSVFDAPRGQTVMLRFEPGHSVLDAFLFVAYFGLLTFLGKGRTPGKRLLKIRVMPITHSHLTLWQSIERALGYAASALEAGFGFWQYFIHPNRQTVHDRIAETIVIDERRRQESESPTSRRGSTTSRDGASAASRG